MPSPSPKSTEPLLLRFRCTHCGKLTAGKQMMSDNGTDGHQCFPRRHYTQSGDLCQGTHLPAEPVRVPASQVKTRMN